MTYKIITDSTTDLSDAYMAAHDVVMLGLTVTLDETTYQTVGLDRLTSDVLLEKIQNNEIDVDSALFINDISYSLHKPFGIMRYVLQLIYDVTILSIILFYGAGVSLEASIFLAFFIAFKIPNL